MMKTPTFNSLGPSHSRPAAGIPKRETAIYEDDRTVLTVIIGDGNQSIRCHMQCLGLYRRHAVSQQNLK